MTVENSNSSGDGAPVASVIIPTYQRPERLAACLSALADSEASGFEIVVVDDGSEPSVEPVVAAYRSKGSEARYVRQANAGPAAARNRGVDAARSDILIFTDDDCRPTPGWVGEMITAVRSAEDALVGGHVENGLTADLLASVSQDLTTYVAEESVGGPTYFASNNIACHRRAFDAVGRFDDSFGLIASEDRDFGQRWHATGRPLVYRPEAVVLHDHAMTLGEFWRQQVAYGRGAGRLRARGDEGGGHSFSGPRFYWRLLTYPVRKKRPRPVTRLAATALSQLAIAVGMVRGSKAN